jgi:hypothetical protein
MLGRRTPPAVGALQLFQLSAVRRACNVQEYHVLVFCRRPWRLRHGSSNRGWALPIPFTQGHRITAQAEGVSVPTPQSPSAADYLALLSTFPGMVFRRQNDEPGTLTFVSEGSRQLLGIAPEELTSGRRSYLSLIHPEDRPAFFAYFNATLLTSP